MNQEILDKLAIVSGAEELRRAIEALCRPVGSLKNIHVFPTEHGNEYLCVVELDSPNLNFSIIEKFGGINFGNGVAFRIPNIAARS